jgi:hypothetical protein
LVTLDFMHVPEQKAANFKRYAPARAAAAKELSLIHLPCHNVMEPSMAEENSCK